MISLDRTYRISAALLCLAVTTASAHAGKTPALTAALAAHQPVIDPVGEQLNMQLTAGTKTGTFENKRHYAAVLAFYRDRDWRPVWIIDGEPTAKATGVIRRLKRAYEDGLDPADYPVPFFDFAKSGNAETEAIADAELHLSLSALTYAEHAQAGRFDPKKKISGYIKQRPVRPDPIAVLQRLANARTPGNVLAAYNPPHVQYKRLRMKLAELRAEDTEKTPPPEPIPAGPSIRFGDADQRVPLLRERLETKVPGEDIDIELFDDALSSAVKTFQRANRLRPDGIVGPRTLAALNGESDANKDPIGDIVANMERWRWVPRKLGRFHIHVNIPEFVVRAKRGGRTIHTTRVVVGKRTNQTPIFSDEMEHVVVNPYWNVPYSIASKEMLPRIQANPGAYFSRRGYEVVHRGRVVSPYSVVWSASNLRNIRIRQRPGARNALGRIKFMFPNKHAIYLHDTPSKSLFKRDVRAYSHGCVRVHNPLEFADVVLAGSSWNSKRIKKMFGGRERRIDLPDHIPVHITYFTTMVNDSGSVINYRDIYGHHRKTRAALGL